MISDWTVKSIAVHRETANLHSLYDSPYFALSCSRTTSRSITAMRCSRKEGKSTQCHDPISSVCNTPASCVDRCSDAAQSYQCTKCQHAVFPSSARGLIRHASCYSKRSTNHRHDMPTAAIRLYMPLSFLVLLRDIVR